MIAMQIDMQWLMSDIPETTTMLMLIIIQVIDGLDCHALLESVGQKQQPQLAHAFGCRMTHQTNNAPTITNTCDAIHNNCNPKRLFQSYGDRTSQHNKQMAIIMINKIIIMDTM